MECDIYVASLLTYNYRYVPDMLLYHNFLNIDSKVIKLKASSKTEALKWIQSISDAIIKLRSQYITPEAAHN